jgi:hypothetical protein
MKANTRHWSIFFNQNGQDIFAFRGDVLVAILYKMSPIGPLNSNCSVFIQLNASEYRDKKLDLIQTAEETSVAFGYAYDSSKDKISSELLEGINQRVCSEFNFYGGSKDQVFLEHLESSHIKELDYTRETEEMLKNVRSSVSKRYD